MHSGPAQYEDANKTPAKMLSIRLSRQSMLFEANLKHSRQSQDTMQSELPNETTIPVVPLYIGMNIVNKPFISNNFNNKNVSDRMHNDKSLVQYHHNFDNNDEHDECDDDTSECYDLDEVYGNRNDVFEGNSPGHNITNILHSRLSMHSEANFRHKAQSQDTTQSDTPNETTSCSIVYRYEYC